MFWERFYDLCIKKNTKPNTVAKEVGLSTATATKWKNGSVPNGEVLTKIADHLGCSVDYLLGRASTPEPTPKSPLDQELEGIDFALFGEVKDLTDAEKQDIINFIKFTKSQRKPE